MRQVIFSSALGALACLLPLTAVGQNTPGPPNVVLIITDDLGWGDLSSYGAPDIRTPNIDAIGREGVRLTDFYANGVLCSPTRAGLISGRYQHRYAILSALGGAPDTRGLVVTGNSLPFTNDNGGEWLARNEPFFHRKWTVWEGGIRVPALLRWPGHIPAGRVSDQVGITMDLTATILTLAGATVPEDLEGIDLLASEPTWRSFGRMWPTVCGLSSPPGRPMWTQKPRREASPGRVSERKIRCEGGA